MTDKEKAIYRCSAFLADRISYAMSTGDRSSVTPDAIRQLLRQEFDRVKEGTKEKEKEKEGEG